MIWRIRLLLGDLGWRVLLVLGVVLFFAQAVLFGAVSTPTALIFAGLLSAWAALIVLALPGPGLFVASVPLATATAGALLLSAWILLTLTPLVGAWASPVWAAVGLPGLITYDRAATLAELVKLAALAAVFVAGLTIGRQRRQVRFLLRLLGGAVAIYAAWAIVSFWIDPDMLLGQEKRYHQNRLTASFLSANTAGSFFGAFAVLFAVLAAEEGLNQARRTPEFGETFGQGPSPTLVLFTFATVLCLGALWLTASRFAVAATAAGLALGALLFALLAGLRAWMAGLIGIGALSLAFLLPILTKARAVSRAWNIDETAANRMAAFENLWNIGLERAWQGYGMGSFRPAISPAMDEENLRRLWDLGAAHNLGLQWFIEGGAIGAGLGALAMFGVLAALFPFPLDRSRPGRARMIAGLGFAVVLLSHNLVDYSLQVPAVSALFALVLGLAAAPVLQGKHKGEAA